MGQLREKMEADLSAAPGEASAVVLSGSEVFAILNAIRKPKYHAMLTTVYAGAFAFPRLAVYATATSTLNHHSGQRRQRATDHALRPSSLLSARLLAV